MKTIVTRAVCLTLVSAAVSAWAFSGDAYADKQRAPIRYAGQPSPQPADQAVQSPIVQSAPATVNADSRIEFLYPDQTAPAASTQKPSTAEQPAATSSGRLVLNAEPRVTYAAAPRTTPAPELRPVAAPQLSAPKLRGAAAPAQPIRIASLKTDKPASTGTPLTLSRVKVNRDAPIGEERGKASIYTDGFDGAPTANGEIFDETAMTAAHPSLPLPSLVQVINEDNRREIVVRVNDRGPFDGQRILELSPRAGTVLGMTKGGTANVRLRYLGPAPVKQNPIANEPVQPQTQSFASSRVEDESLPPVTATTPIVRQPAPLTTVADYGEPSLGVPDPVQPVQASAPIGTGNVFIQAGAFADIANAQSLTRALGRGHSVRIEEARVNGSDYFRVLIGPYTTTQAAEIQRSQLSRAGIVDGFLTTR